VPTAAALLTALLFTSIARADVPESVLEAMKERDVVVHRTNGEAAAGRLVGFTEADVTVLGADGQVVLIDRAEIQELTGAVTEANDSAETNGRVKRESDLVLEFAGNYDDAYQTVATTILEMKGKVNTRKADKNRLVGSFRYGLNMFGLKVSAEFEELPDERVQITFNGYFVDSIDAAGVSKKKAKEVADACAAALR